MMAPEAARAKTLRRIRRLREIEAVGLQRELSEARAKEMQLRSLQMKTQNMADEYSLCRGAANGAELLQQAGLAHSLAKLSEQAAEQVREAEAKTDRSTAQLAKLDHQKERMGDRITELDNIVWVRTDARTAEVANGATAKRGGSLARGLLKE